MGKVEELLLRVRAAEEELARLRAELQAAEDETKTHPAPGPDQTTSEKPWKWPLPPEDYERYARQLIIPQVGVPGKAGFSFPQHRSCFVKDRRTPRDSARPS
jgi:hypothetical protein